MTTLHIWTDGASKGNPGIGGWGAHLVWGTKALDLFDGAPDVTNNQMELMAVIEALSAVRKPCPIVIHMDSTYVRDGITKWIHGWKKNGWKNAQKQPVKNADLWKTLDSLVNKFDIEWRWVKGHNGDPGNERADYLANLGCEVAQGMRKAQRCR